MPILTVVALAAVAIWVRAEVEALAALAEADVAEREARPDDAIVKLGRAARWRLHQSTALARLRGHALAAERLGQPGRARTAWSEIRQATLATRAFGIGEPPILGEANLHLAQHLSGVDGRAYAATAPGAGFVGSLCAIIGLALVVTSLWVWETYYSFRYIRIGIGGFLFFLGLFAA
ncbi:MAG: hypothetical protein AABZ30_01870 [Myxococcota bacterium]